MGQENVAMARLSVELFRGRDTTRDTGFGEDDLARTSELFDPDVELDATRAPMRDIRGRYQGIAGMVEFWSRWLEAWESLELENEITDAGDAVLIAISQMTMRGKGSGAEVEFPSHWHVLSFRDGRIVRDGIYFDEGEARAAAGLHP